MVVIRNVACAGAVAVLVGFLCELVLRVVFVSHEDVIRTGALADFYDVAERIVLVSILFGQPPPSCRVR